MRVTQDGLFDSRLYDLQRRFDDYARFQRDSGTGKKVSTVADDPVAARSILQLNNEQAQGQRYLRNIEDGMNRLTPTESAISRVEELLSNARSKIVSAGNGAITSDDRRNIANDLNSIIDQLYSVLNQESNGVYVFGGTRGEDQPLTVSRNAAGEISGVSADWLGLNSTVLRDIAPGDTVAVSISLSQMRSANGTGSDPLTFLIQARDQIRSGTGETEVTTTLEKIDSIRNAVSAQHARIGTAMDRLNAAKAQWSERDLAIIDKTSQLQDWDMAELLLKFKQTESAYSTALSVTPQLLDLSLMKFIS